MNYTVQYYDLVLVAIVTTMGLGAPLGVLAPLALPTVLTSAGLLAALFIAHGPFVNGPVDSPEDLTDEVDALNRDCRRGAVAPRRRRVAFRSVIGQSGRT
jgi:hypothetical protein